MTLRTLVAAAALYAMAGPALADQTSGATPAATAPAAAKPKPDASHTIVCKTSGTTGTRLGGTRVCLTAEQWAERDEQTREVMTRTQASPASH